MYNCKQFLCVIRIKIVIVITSGFSSAWQNQSQIKELFVAASRIHGAHASPAF